MKNVDGIIIKIEMNNKAEAQNLETTLVVEQETSSFKENFKTYFKSCYKVSVFDITLAGVLLALHIIIMCTTKMTILRIIPLEIDFVFFISYGLFFGPLKGPLIAGLADLLTMLITGTIGTWYWGYAITPLLISFLTSFYFFFFKNSLWFRRIAPFVIIVIAFSVLIATLVKENMYQNGFNIDPSRKNRDKFNIPGYIIIAMVCIFAALIFLTLAFFAIKNETKTKSNKWNDYLLVFSTIIFIILIFRWIIGTYVYIGWNNHMVANPLNGKPSKRVALDYHKDFYIVFVPIMIKTLFTIPIYVITLTPIFSVLSLLQDKTMSNKNSTY